MTDLPRPVTTQDHYLEAILEELRKLTAQLPEAGAGTDLVALRERLQEIRGIGPAKADEILERIQG